MGTRRAVAAALDTICQLRGAEIIRQDVVVEDGVITGFRDRLAVSYRPGLGEPPLEDLPWRTARVYRHRAGPGCVA